MHQPVFESLPAKSDDGSLDIVDFQSWKSFSYLLSVSTWPCILSYLEKGKEFIDNRSCQVRNSTIYKGGTDLLSVICLSFHYCHLFYYVFFCESIFLVSDDLCTFLGSHSSRF